MTITIRYCLTCGKSNQEVTFRRYSAICNPCIPHHKRKAPELSPEEKKRLREVERNHKKYIKFREKRCAEAKTKYYANIEQERERMRLYAQTHKESRKVVRKVWEENHRLERAEYMRKRAAKKRGLTVGDVSYERVLERDGMYCYICEQSITPDHKIAFDHVIPLERGGPHSEDNIKVTHSVCNSRKHCRLLEEMTTYQRRGVSWISG